MTTNIVTDLGVGGEGCGDLALHFGEDLVAKYEFRWQGRDVIGKLTFACVAAFRFSDELHSAGYERGSYDVLVEILDSTWCDELARKNGSRGGETGATSHFAVFVSNNGYLEVLAARCVADVPGIGIARSGSEGSRPQ